MNILIIVLSSLSYAVAYLNSPRTRNFDVTQPRRALFDVLSASSLSTCVSSSSSSLSNCSMKMIVTGAIQNGDTDGTSYISYDVSSSPMQLPNSDGFTSVYSPDTVSISIRQSEISLIYPTSYIRDVNDGPYELVFLKDASNHAFVNPTNRCQAGALSDSASCGWAVNSNGVRVPYSQGFCCECTTQDAFTSYTMTRSGETCVFTQAHDSAHCLRMSSLWHSLYSIGSPILTFRLVVSIYQCRLRTSNTRSNSSSIIECHEPSNDCECEFFDSSLIAAYLGPEQPTRCFALPLNPNPLACDVEVRLQGTFAPYEGTPDFSSKYLLVPTQCESGTPPTDACWQRVLGSSDQWMIVDKEGVSVSGGSECNKIGVSYEAFSTQGRACESNRGSCLANQPYDLYQSDLLSLSQQRQTRYFLSSFRDSSTLSTPTTTTGSDKYAPVSSKTPADLLLNRQSNSMVLSLRTRRFQKSVLSLTFRADSDSLRLIVKSAPGKLHLLKKFSLIAGSSSTLLVVIVENTGEVNARYTISIECPQDGESFILPIPAREIGVAARMNASTTFSINSNTNLVAKIMECAIVLVDASGSVTDKKALSVESSNAEIDRGGQGGEIVDVNGRSGSSSNSSVASICGARCPSYWDIACAVSNVSICINSVSNWATGLALGSILLMIAALYAAFKYPQLFLAPFRAIGGLCCGTGSNATPNANSASNQTTSTAAKNKNKRSVKGGGGGGSNVSARVVVGRGQKRIRDTIAKSSTIKALSPSSSKSPLSSSSSASSSLSSTSSSVEVDIVSLAFKSMTQTQLKETLRRTRLLIREEAVNSSDNDHDPSSSHREDCVTSNDSKGEEENDNNTVIVNATSNHATSKPTTLSRPLHQTDTTTKTTKKKVTERHFF